MGIASWQSPLLLRVDGHAAGSAGRDWVALMGTNSCHSSKRSGASTHAQTTGGRNDVQRGRTCAHFSGQ
eukprot:scaffold95059_cov34-Tisochrysis_lutea.AAC.2